MFTREEVMRALKTAEAFSSQENLEVVQNALSEVIMSLGSKDKNLRVSMMEEFVGEE
jgi:hypothetical protein